MAHFSAGQISDVEHIDRFFAEGCNMRGRNIEVELPERGG